MKFKSVYLHFQINGACFIHEWNGAGFEKQEEEEAEEEEEEEGEKEEEEKYDTPGCAPDLKRLALSLASLQSLLFTESDRIHLFFRCVHARGIVRRSVRRSVRPSDRLM